MGCLHVMDSRLRNRLKDYPTSKKEREIPDCRIIDWSVPMRISEWSGTGIVMVDSGIRFCITI
jgi:hypothetical protein